MFGPKNDEEREIYAAEKFRVDFQHKLHMVMRHEGVTQKELARRLKVTESRVSQIFSSKCNVTVRMMARAFHVLNDECVLDSEKLRAVERKRLGGCARPVRDAWTFGGAGDSHRVGSAPAKKSQSSEVLTEVA